MAHPRRRWLLLAALIVVATVGLLIVRRGLRSMPVPAAVTWTPQPDRFSFVSTIKGSRVEFSLALFTGQRATPPPAFLSHLPKSIQGPLANSFTRAEAALAKSRWRIQVDAPPFVVVDNSRVDFHSSLGLMVIVQAHLDTERIGDFTGNLRASLRDRTGATNAIEVPIQVKVLPPPASKPRRILVTETPYEMYSTGQGTDLEPTGRVVERLIERGVQLDFCERMPSSLAAYDLILLAGSTLVDLAESDLQRLRERLGKGAHVVLVADAFFHGTSQKATQMLLPYGLRMENQDAGSSVTNVTVVDDPLTQGVRAVGFWRPALIAVTDPGQGKVLVREEDGPGGFIAVSRAPGRGEVRVLAQSLWWSWLKGDQGRADNTRLMEQLLTP